MAAPALLYLLKANVVLALFAAAYYGLLRRAGFLGLNRAYVLLAAVFAAVFPALPLPALLPALSLALPVRHALQAAAHPALAGGPSWWLLAGTLYLAGTLALLLRLLGQLLSLGQLHGRSRPATLLGQPVRVVPGTGGPFSFGHTIYLSAATLAEAAGQRAALRHEQAHVRQGHTLDVLLLHLLAALAWPNPAAWLLRRAALLNLEYLADAAALQPGDVPRRTYLYALLRQQATLGLNRVPVVALAFWPTASSLKSRVWQLGQPRPPRRRLARYALAGPLLVLLVLGYAMARPAPAPLALPAGVACYLDGQPTTATAVAALPAETIASVQVLSDPSELWQMGRTGQGLVIVTTKANEYSPRVRALAAQLGLAAGYRSRPAPLNELVPKEQAYITRHYPNAQLAGAVDELTQFATGAVQYRVPLTGRRPFYLYFSPQGEVLPAPAAPTGR